MSIEFRSFVLFALVLFFSFDASYSQKRPKDRILDKKEFTIKLELLEDKKNKPDPIDDELSFRSNKAWSQHMQSQSNGGFLRGDYVVKKEEVLGEEVYVFQIINKNTKGMSLKWEGRVLGEKIEGTATVSKKGKIKEEYTFTGEVSD
eukprot:Rmarinus@m.17841